MSRHNVESAIHAVGSEIEQGLKSLVNAHERAQQLKPPYNQESISEARDLFSNHFLEKVRSFVSAYQSESGLKEFNVSQETKLFKPKDRQDEILFELKRQNINRQLQQMKPEEIVTMYENSNGMTDIDKAAFEVEALGVLQGKGEAGIGQAGRFKTVLGRKRRERLSEDTKNQIDYLESRRNLYKAANRILDNAVGEGLNSYHLYSWLSQSGNKNNEKIQLARRLLGEVELSNIG